MQKTSLLIVTAQFPTHYQSRTIAIRKHFPEERTVQKKVLVVVFENQKTSHSANPIFNRFRSLQLHRSRIVMNSFAVIGLSDKHASNVHSKHFKLRKNKESLTRRNASDCRSYELASCLSYLEDFAVWALHHLLCS